MANFFGTYAFDIWTVAAKRNVDVGVGFDMFRVDIANGRPQNCGDALPGFDFSEAKAEWDKLGEVEQKQAIEDYDNFVHDHYREACDAFANGKEACDALAQEA